MQQGCRQAEAPRVEDDLTPLRLTRASLRCLHAPWARLIVLQVHLDTPRMSPPVPWHPSVRLHLSALLHALCCSDE